jgi:hydrogenase maturation protein HypF
MEQRVVAAAQSVSVGLSALPSGHPAVLGVGGDLKSSVCLLVDRRATLWWGFGDLRQAATYREFLHRIDGLIAEHGVELVGRDLHPQYLTTFAARRSGLESVAVQHHHAHIASVQAEHDEPGPVIGVACDGAGYGPDGAVWGCELILAHRGSYRRLGHLEYFPLVGGDAAAVETWRPAAALLRETAPLTWRVEYEHALRNASHAAVDRFERQARAAVNAPLTSSLGRAFDAASYLIGLVDRNDSEAQAAMALEAAATRTAAPLPYHVALHGAEVVMSLRPAIAALADAPRCHDVGRPAAAFHETVARMLADGAVLACRTQGVTTVALSGGVFLNRRLRSRLVELLAARGLRVLTNRMAPVGDGGLALGQAFAAAWAPPASRRDVATGEDGDAPCA